MSVEPKKRGRLTAEELAAAVGANMDSIPLDHLTPDSALGIEFGEEFALIDVSLIDTSPYQPRFSFDEKGIEELAESIRSEGLNQPVTLRKKSGGRYELIAGERRMLATKKLARSQVPALIRHVDVRTAARSTISENLQRESLFDIEIAYSLQKALDDKIEDSISGLSRLSAMDRSDVRRCLDMLTLPQEALDRIRNNAKLLSRTGAEKLLKFLESVDGGGEHRKASVLLVLDQIEAGNVPQTRCDEWLESNWLRIKAGGHVQANEKQGRVAAKRAMKMPVHADNGDAVGHVTFKDNQISLKITDPEKLSQVRQAIATMLGVELPSAT